MSRMADTAVWALDFTSDPMLDGMRKIQNEIPGRKMYLSTCKLCRSWCLTNQPHSSTFCSATLEATLLSRLTTVMNILQLPCGSGRLYIRRPTWLEADTGLLPPCREGSRSHVPRGGSKAGAHSARARSHATAHLQERRAGFSDSSKPETPAAAAGFRGLRGRFQG